MRIMRKDIGLLVLMLAMMLSSCATLRHQAAGNEGESTATEETAAPENGDTEKTKDQLSDYILGPDDIVRVVVEQHTEWSGEFTVRPDGNVFIPSIGEFRMEGHSEQTAAIALSTYLEKYINNPRVTVQVVRYASQTIYVLGEVSRPGKYSTEGKSVTVRDAIVLAGLTTRFAAESRVYVINPAQKRPSQQVVNLNRILNRGELAQNIQLKPGYIVYVPKTIWGHINDLVSVVLSPFTSTATSLPAARAALVP